MEMKYMKKKSRFLICIALCLLAVSCSNLLNRGNDDTSADNKESDTAKKSYIFKGSLNLSGAIPEFLNFEKDSSLSKSAVPNISGTDWNSYYWQIDAVSGGVTKSINSKTNSNYFTSSSNPSVVEFIFDSLDEGNWDFTASLKKLASATPASNDSTIMKDTYPNINIGDALPIVTHSFILKPSQTANTGKGSIELPLTIPSSIKKITATSTTDGWSDITLNPTTTSVTLSVSNIQSKTYEVTFSFFNANNILLYTTIQTINVFDNMKTNTWLSDGTSIFNTSNTPVTFELTETIMNQFARTSIYVGVPAGLTEVTASDITGTGSPFAPVESVTKAAQIIANTGSSTCDFRIFICGEITGAQEVKNITSEMANSITITGYSGNTNNRLKGGSSGSVLYLDTDVSVTIKNLTITGGKGTEVSSTLCGGGIYIAAGTVKLTDGAIIAGNTAANGGGVYLAGSDSNLFMYGSALIGAQADSYPTKAEDASNSADNGGGIYNNGGSVYLGYSKYVSSSNKTESDITAGYGIRRNYAVFYSGIQSEGGTVLIRSGSISNNGTKYDEDWKGYGGALGVTAVGTYTISGGTFSSNYARNGGVVYIKEVAEEDKDNPIVVNISGGTFSNNTGVGGGVIRVEKNSKVVISGSPTFTGNNATATGGVIYNDKGIITMTGGTMGGANDSDQNTCGTGIGGAIYQDGTFNLSGSAKIFQGSTKKNDVYLVSGKKITIDANYTGDGNNDESKISVTPNSLTRGLAILDGSKLTSTNKDYFSITNAEWSIVTTGDTTLTGHINAPLYVAGTTALTGYGAGSSSGDGTASKPYDTIETAVNKCWNSEIDFTINIVGTVNGAQIIPAADTTNNKALAKSITLLGVTVGNNQPTLNRSIASASSDGTTLTINHSKPVIIQNLIITGGKKTGNGGGIYLVKAGGTLTLTTDAVITGNTASLSGGGVYIAGESGDGKQATLLMEETSQISKNKAFSDGDSYGGGGVYLSYANLCMNGSALIGDIKDSSNNAITSAASNTNDNTKSNYAYYGAGVRCDANSVVWLGYSAPDADSKSTLSNSYGIWYNCASQKGGGIYIASGGTVNFNSGSIAFNCAVYSSESIAYGGGGIYNQGSLSMTGGVIKGNKGLNGGGIYHNSSATSFVMSAGTIGDTNYQNTATGSFSSQGGGAIYAGKSFNLGQGSNAGNIYIVPSNEAKTNDIFLKNYSSKILMSARLSNTNLNNKYIALYIDGFTNSAAHGKEIMTCTGEDNYSYPSAYFSKFKILNGNNIFGITCANESGPKPYSGIIYPTSTAMLSVSSNESSMTSNTTEVIFNESNSTHKTNGTCILFKTQDDYYGDYFGALIFKPVTTSHQVTMTLIRIGSNQYENNYEITATYANTLNYKGFDIESAQMLPSSDTTYIADFVVRLNGSDIQVYQNPDNSSVKWYRVW